MGQFTVWELQVEELSPLNQRESGPLAQSAWVFEEVFLLLSWHPLLSIALGGILLLLICLVHPFHLFFHIFLLHLLEPLRNMNVREACKLADGIVGEPELGSVCLAVVEISQLQQGILHVWIVQVHLLLRLQLFREQDFITLVAVHRLIFVFSFYWGFGVVKYNSKDSLNRN